MVGVAGVSLGIVPSFSLGASRSNRESELSQTFLGVRRFGQIPALQGVS